ncbi:MAG: glycosyl hydrolase 2 galactose-binding domain-containing protein, partial [Actinomycetes bacterium]
MQHTPEDGRRRLLQLESGWWAAPADEGRRRTLPDPGAPMEGWVRAEVPGHWADDPHLPDHVTDVLHRVEFSMDLPDPTERVWLVLDGIAGTADVWMDGDLLGDTDAPFVAHAFEITDTLALHAERLVALDVSCPPRKGGRTRDLLGSLRAANGGTPGGPWRSVRVERSGPVRLGATSLRPAGASHQRAQVRLRWSLDTLLPRTVTIRTTISGPGTTTTDERTVPLAAGLNRQESTIVVADPVRWWPHALGTPDRYDVCVEVLLSDDDPERGETPVSDRVQFRTGLRTVERDATGWRINGELLFLQGIQLDDTVGERALDERLDRAVAAGVDLVRVVGRPPSSTLLDLADERGLLVWADLPVVGRQHRSTRSRAVRQARRIVANAAHHPAIALWCCHDRAVLGADLLIGDRALAGAVGTAHPDVPVLLRAPQPTTSVPQNARRPKGFTQFVVAAPATSPDDLARVIGAARAHALQSTA